MSRLLGLMLLLLSGGASAAARFAIVVGSNQGSNGHDRLWFAERDAERLSQALSELGDFASDHVQLLRGARRDELEKALRQTEAQIARARAAGERTLLLFYFS